MLKPMVFKPEVLEKTKRLLAKLKDMVKTGGTCMVNKSEFIGKTK